MLVKIVPAVLAINILTGFTSELSSSPSFLLSSSKLSVYFFSTCQEDQPIVKTRIRQKVLSPNSALIIRIDAPETSSDK